MTGIVSRKVYPDGYPVDALQILSSMSFSNGRNVVVVGSMALRSQIYAGDYDANETVQVHSIHNTVLKFKDIIRNLQDIPLTYIGDIKSGSIEEWKVIGDTYNYKESKQKLDELLLHEIITKKEHSDGLKLLKPHMTKLDLLEAQNFLRFHIIRWKPNEILKGYKILVDGRKFTLEQAFESPTITKLDVVSWIQNSRFTDFSIIYTFKKNGKILNPGMRDFENAIRENIFMLKHEGNYFKMAKRMFALARYKKYNSVLQILSNMFNGDLGRLYIVYGDLGTLESMFETPIHIPNEKVEFELDQFRSRLSNIGLPKYLEAENSILLSIDKLMELSDKDTVLKQIKDLKEKLYKLLTHYAKQYIEAHNIMP